MATILKPALYAVKLIVNNIPFLAHLEVAQRDDKNIASRCNSHFQVGTTVDKIDSITYCETEEDYKKLADALKAEKISKGIPTVEEMTGGEPELVLHDKDLVNQ